ncbi:peptidoglycan DD-metalloendopeptidase family protein [uncultured Dokdonia sp.]|uniref:peptidoglycan DD-metalloendopeptidase family protein n=1 Tax=uncultured Dokdonia sp. TaxID=575653 RepID=UPI0026318885|nr:peptidoglycan DD-metalloendopeptidase family protein [uncultured Dokdonia sp.]
MVLITTLTSDFTPVVSSQFNSSAYTPLDLSSTNKTLNVEILKDPERHHAQLLNFLKERQAKVAYGGYLEQRKLYDRSDYFQAATPDDKRNIHLGIDLWCDAGTSVIAPLDGTIHSFQENTNFGDYGPTIILKHEMEDDTFHTLYGHLSRTSLEGLEVGKKVKAGEQIATLGAPFENGDYAPHLHFQIIIDMQGKKGDYPGVCSKNKLPFYKENCPDPNLLLKIY